MTMFKRYKWKPLMLAMSILLASGGISLDAHYCQGNWMGFSILKKAASCHSNDKKASCPRHSEEKSEKDCCSSDRIFLDMEEDLTFSESLTVAAEYEFYNPNNFSSLAWNEVRIDKTLHWFNLKPPLIVESRYLLFQSFLI